MDGQTDLRISLSAPRPLVHLMALNPRLYEAEPGSGCTYRCATAPAPGRAPGGRDSNGVFTLADVKNNTIGFSVKF